MTEHIHKAMEVNTTGGSDLLVPTNRSGIARRYSVTGRILELCIEVPPRSLTTCVAHDGIVDESAIEYVFTIKTLNTIRNFVTLPYVRSGEAPREQHKVIARRIQYL